MEPNFDLNAYEPPVSLWSIVEQHIPIHEHEEIKGMLGESLVDQSLELRTEVIQHSIYNSVMHAMMCAAVGKYTYICHDYYS